MNTKIGFKSFELSMYGTYERTFESEQVLPALYLLYQTSSVSFVDFKRNVVPHFLTYKGI